MILVTGGAGFIGTNFILDWLQHSNESVVNVDRLSYAGNLINLNKVSNNSNHHFISGDIGDIALMSQVLTKFRPRAVINFAAETHVDRSIHTPKPFIETNIVAVFNLLEAVTHYWNQGNTQEKSSFRFIQISTDEVYGSLMSNDPSFKEENKYKPNSPYAASKASSDHLVRAYFHTYGLPSIITNCSNNYGPYQFPEKLIPLIIYNAIHDKPLPIYGDGLNIRDWLYVSDHCAALRSILDKGQVGENYNIGGDMELNNLEIVHTICSILDEIKPRFDRKKYAEQITFVKDRPGHDRRYAINASKIKQQLGWNAKETFISGIRKTVDWYLANNQWLEARMGSNHTWMTQQYGEIIT